MTNSRYLKKFFTTGLIGLAVFSISGCSTYELPMQKAIGKSLESKAIEEKNEFLELKNDLKNRDYSSGSQKSTATNIKSDNLFKESRPAFELAVSRSTPIYPYIVQKGDTLSVIATNHRMTVKALKELNSLTSEKIIVGQKLSVTSKPVTTSGKTATSTTAKSNPVQQVIKADWWSQGNALFPIYAKATITDIDSGLSFQVQRRGGTNHADVQPLTAKDTSIMKKIYGGEWSWNRKAILVTVNEKVLAASMNGMPHGDGAIQNNDFPGHFCIHMLNSRTHGSNKVDSQHQSMIEKASKIVIKK